GMFLRLDRLAGALTVGEDEAVALPRQSGRLVLGTEGVDTAERHTQPETGRNLQRGSSVQQPWLPTTRWKDPPHLPCMRGPRVRGFLVGARRLSRPGESQALGAHRAWEGLAGLPALSPGVCPAGSRCCSFYARRWLRCCP